MADEVEKALPQPPPPAPVVDPSASTGGFGPAPVMDSGMTFREIGSSGLRQFSGWVREEFLPTLVGRQAAQKYREMQDNSPYVGSVLFAVMATMRKVEWRVVPPNDSGPAKEMAEFVETCMADMSHSWEDLTVESLSMLPFGFAPHEIVYKRRLGRDPSASDNSVMADASPEARDAVEQQRRLGKVVDLPSSKFDDGRIGWRRLPLRGQDTVLKWSFDGNGQVQAMTQQPWVGPIVTVPIEKMLLFRPTHAKGNPEGRALDPNTMITTPTGLRMMDELRPGDQVFDENNQPCNVVARQEWEGRPSLALFFDDGDGAKETIIADDNHEWPVGNDKVTTFQLAAEHLPHGPVRISAGRAEYHTLIKAERVKSRRTVCIEVDSHSHLFLAGRTQVPTHNSILRTAYISYYYAKRLQEQEAIVAERMGGIPEITVPLALMEAAKAGDPGSASAMLAYKKMATNIRVDEQMGIVLPSDTFPGPNGPSSVRKYGFQLVAPQNRAASVDFDKMITRHNIAITTSVLADFISLGHEAHGTQSLAVSKVDMFFQAIEGFLNSNAGVFNRFALPRLWALNAFDFDLMPTIEPDLAQRVDLDVLSNFVLRLSQSGMPLFPNEELQTALLDAAGLPDVDDDRALQAAGMSDTQLDAKDDQAEAAADRAKNPPAPVMAPGGPGQPAKPTSPLQKMIAASVARRMIRFAGPRFGITTKRNKPYRRIGRRA